MHTRLLDIVTLTLITITFTLTPPLALLILLFDAPCEHTRVCILFTKYPGTVPGYPVPGVHHSRCKQGVDPTP